MASTTAARSIALAAVVLSLAGCGRAARDAGTQRSTVPAGATVTTATGAVSAAGPASTAAVAAAPSRTTATVDLTGVERDLGKVDGDLGQTTDTREDDPTS